MHLGAEEDKKKMVQKTNKKKKKTTAIGRKTKIAYAYNQKSVGNKERTKTKLVKLL